ncbi:unnamed protein product [Vitrella brassicaformis CCMP3155]|uniref:Uncharacterized protein n=1 Tax=Vitrella brassicaformis (strain CCMP3155) TaxID=1169540 RepID=A0A0G4ERA9_VITBC|nr:unnamed protein product [Vitrella brassicaformis CCMP3155]|eukprot:CEM00554.1 unnamed protein product [Vitrella brassicaformis CCMP3155]
MAATVGLVNSIIAREINPPGRYVHLINTWGGDARAIVAIVTIHSLDDGAHLLSLIQLAVNSMEGVLQEWPSKKARACVVKELVSAGADVNFGQPIWNAVDEMDLPLFKELLAGDPQVLSLRPSFARFLRLGDILRCAVTASDPEVLTWMLNHGIGRHINHTRNRRILAEAGRAVADCRLSRRGRTNR